MKIGKLNITGFGALAPMAGASDAAFRHIAHEFGASYTVTEMISSRALDYDDRKTMELADISHDQGPVFIQIFGDDPECMARAAQKMAALGPAGIDINMGCPAPKIVASGGGCALMRNPALCGKIVEAVRKAVGDLPVTAKMRAGWSWGNPNAPEIAKICQEAGADAVCIHGRTRDQFYSGQVEPEIMGMVKQAVTIPVIANGDVGGPDSAERLLNATGCDLVLVGRGALGNPWIFKALNSYFGTGRHIEAPGMEEKMRVMRLHAELMCAYKGEERAMLEMRKHAGWYLSGLRWASRYKRQVVGLRKLKDLDLVIEGIIRMNELEKAGKVYPTGKRIRDDEEKDGPG